MPRGRRVLAVTWIAVLLAAAAAAQPAPVPFAFSVSTPDPASHLFHVRLDCMGLPPGDTVEFRMPAWTPGYYGLFDFAAHVRDLAASDGEGRSLPVAKTGPNAWTVRRAGAKRTVLSYQVLATSPFVANAFLDETRGYLLPGALFLYVPGELRRPATVAIDLYPKWSAVATGLDPVPGAAHTYAAADFDVLYDSPILLGNLESLPPFEIDGVPHRFVGHALGEFDRPQLVDDLRAVVEAGIRIIGDIPYKHYTFLGIGPGRGGIEHLNSAAVSFSGIGADRASRIRTLAFLAHEYFHHYNVKRIRPLALGPFDYGRPNLTDMLWVSEGFTVYYEYLMLARSGRMTGQDLLEALSRTIAACESNPGKFFQSATESSRDTWTQGPFGRGGNGGVPRTISYYDKGAVLALLLDLRIRHETGNARSLDTVMRSLYGQYYKKLDRGWTDEEFRRVCEEVAGVGLAEIFEYASTTRPVDYARYLAYAGLEFEPPRRLDEAALGALAEDTDGALRVAAVEPGSPAARAGIAGGDIIAAVDGAVLDAAGLTAAISAKKPGERVRLDLRRGSTGQTVGVTLDARQEHSWRLVPTPDATPLQKAILAALTS